MLKGYLKSKSNKTINQRRISAALKHVAPLHQQARNNNTARMLNLIPYRADYFGHKLHLDQNEKLVMYGVTHVIDVDRHSRFVVAAKCMAIKKSKVIYSEVYRLVLNFIFALFFLFKEMM